MGAVLKDLKEGDKVWVDREDGTPPVLETVLELDPSWGDYRISDALDGYSQWYDSDDGKCYGRDKRAFVLSARPVQHVPEPDSREAESAEILTPAEVLHCHKEGGAYHVLCRWPDVKIQHKTFELQLREVRRAEANPVRF